MVTGMETRQTEPIPDPTARPTVSVEEAAQFLGISRGSAYAAAREGTLPIVKIGRRLVVPTAALRRLLGIDVPPAEEVAS